MKSALISACKKSHRTLLAAAGTVSPAQANLVGDDGLSILDIVVMRANRVGVLTAWMDLSRLDVTCRDWQAEIGGLHPLHRRTTPAALCEVTGWSAALARLRFRHAALIQRLEALGEDDIWTLREAGDPAAGTLIDHLRHRVIVETYLDAEDIAYRCGQSRVVA